MFVSSPRLARPRLSFFRGLRPASVFRAGQKLFARLRWAKARTVFVFSPRLARPRLSFFRGLRPAPVFRAGQKLFARLHRASRAPCSFSLRVSHARGFHFFGAFARLLCSGRGKSFLRGFAGLAAPAPRLPCVHDTTIFFIIRPGRLVCQISAPAEHGTKKYAPRLGSVPKI